MSSAPDLSVVILNYNVKELLRACLRSVLAGESRHAIEVVVVDHASPDGSAAMVAGEFPSVHLIACDSNGGYAQGNNRGIRASDPRARYVMLLNPDTVVPPSGLGDLIDFMDAHAEVGVVGPKLVMGNGKLDLACRRSFPDPRVAFYHAFALDKLFPRSREFARYNLTFLDEDQPAEIDCVVGAAMLVRRAAMDQAGLLDEAFRMYGEDLDWAYRIKEAGWKVIYNPAVAIVHYKGQSTRQRAVPSILSFYDAMIVFHRKHYAPKTATPINWAITAGIGLRLGLALIANAFKSRAPRSHVFP